MCFWNIGSPTPSYPCTLCIIKSIMFPPKKKKPFPLLHLPFVALHNVIKMMDPHELAKLSICSYRLELHLRSYKRKIELIHIHLSNTFYQLDLFNSKDRFIVWFEEEDENKDLPKSMNTVTRLQQFSRSFHAEFDTALVLFQPFPPSLCFDVSHLLLSLYSSPLIDWAFYMDQLEIETVRRYLDIILQGRCEQITFFRSEMSSEFLTELMDKIPLDKKLRIDSGIPSDFRHPNALKFYGSQYKNGRWITLEDLKTIRNVLYVSLDSTIFNCRDINEFLHYWINCDEKMFVQMELQLDESVQIDEDVLKDGLITLQIVDGTDETCLYLKVKNHHNLCFGLCRLLIYKNKLAEFVSWEVDDQLANKFEILVLLEKKKNLELENEASGTAEERKQEIAVEIEELMNQLTKNNESGYIF
ncbi:hypothetical protein GCK72_003959 [Caenorhabditis remanei]|uniref:F-box domain-containing protein n=1 Tax=Caenorhabditis remanei TaxID=31234 RepID=A0A6A5HCB9_CAERE|nr:hypothetical protein GCK72_003959 [Caenorhabditis remanei]KAF1764013.1 hypothetical protein GCK72_003959 [Caenorhabditis remanei]